MNLVLDTFAYHREKEYSHIVHADAHVTETNRCLPDWLKSSLNIHDTLNPLLRHICEILYSLARCFGHKAWLANVV